MRVLPWNVATVEMFLSFLFFFGWSLFFWKEPSLFRLRGESPKNSALCLLFPFLLLLSRPHFPISIAHEHICSHVLTRHTLHRIWCVKFGAKLAFYIILSLTFNHYFLLLIFHFRRSFFYCCCFFSEHFSVFFFIVVVVKMGIYLWMTESNPNA